MKTSKYVIAAKGPNGSSLVYSTSSGHFGVLGPTALATLSKGQGPWEEELAEAGFLVPNDLNELELQRDAFCAASNDASTLSITIAPTYACNCRCAYCYEQDKLTAKTIMGQDVIQAIYDLVMCQYANDPFDNLWVEWYGGDPQLCLDLVEQISSHLMAWCNDNDVSYDAMILSNSTRIGAMEASLLARCGVTSALVTIDGPQDMHNYRRPAVGEDNAFGKIIEAITHMQDEGIYVNALMNTDKVNAKEFAQLHKWLKDTIGIELSTTKLNDYAHSYGCGTFKAPEFDLFTHEEYAHAGFEMQKEAGLLTKQQIAAMLAPAPLFCRGQNRRYFVIDYKGDVYKCDGWMGDCSRVIGNLLDGVEDLPVAITFNPFERIQCRDCAYLPLCMGNCSWEQERCGWPCHPLVYTTEKYLNEYRSFFPDTGKEFQLFV